MTERTCYLSHEFEKTLGIVELRFNPAINGLTLLIDGEVQGQWVPDDTNERETQTKIVRDYCAEKGWKLAGIYWDNARFCYSVPGMLTLQPMYEEVAMALLWDAKRKEAK